MNSRGLLKIVLVLFGSIAFGLINVNGQTYTSSGLSSNWNDPNAWIKTNPNGNPNFGLTANVPPLGGAPNYPYTSPVNIIINYCRPRTI